MSKTIKEKIKQNALEKIKRFNVKGEEELADDINLYLFEEELPKNSKINIDPKKKKTLTKKTAFVLLDLAPELNWGHPCKHLLFDSETGELYEETDSTFPPNNFFTENNKFEAIHTPKKLPNVLEGRTLSTAEIPALTNVLTNAQGNRYAILFSGESDNRHVNDLEFLYRTLIDVYDFSPSNIYVLNHDGTINYNNTSSYPIGNWPGDNTPYRMQVNDGGTATALESTIDDLATKLQEDDFLLIHVNNHGYRASNVSYIVTYSPISYGIYSSSTFANKISGLPDFAVLMVMMEQCFSGGFTDSVIVNSTAKRTHFAAACEEDRSSIGGAFFDPFALDWIAAMNGQYPNGSSLSRIVDVNQDGRISASEAFDYAYAERDSYDTPVSAENLLGIGSHIFLGLPEHDLYLRDNLLDIGREPTIEGTLYKSPDIIAYNQALSDPQQTLGSAVAMDREDLGEPIEYQQDNFIYLRIQNRGTQATSGTATLFWSYPSTFPTPSSWNAIDQMLIPSLNPDEVKIVGPFTWIAQDIPTPGHYCFIALIQSGDDPAPDPANIQTYTDFHYFINDNNNAAWKNFNIVDMIEGGTMSLIFHIQGWPTEPILSDLVLDFEEFPSETEVTLRILRRLTEDSTFEEISLLNESLLYRQYQINANTTASIRNLNLNSGDDTIASLSIVLPENIVDGSYSFAITQLVNSLEMGRITNMFVVGDHPFIANRNLREIHKSTCKYVEKIKNINKVAYSSIDRGISHGYNGCYYCLPEFDTDNKEAMIRSIEPILLESFYEDPGSISEEEKDRLRDIEDRIVSALRKSG